jgi:hypothetical protein
MKHTSPPTFHARAQPIGWSALSEAIQANPQRGARLLGVAKSASASIAAMPDTDVSLTWLPGWKEDTAFSVTDAVSLFLWISDPLFRTAVAGVRRTMEMEVASALLMANEKEWKARGGRHRGWVRKHLEEDLRGRSAGADPAPDFWEQVRTNKRAALLLDFVCVVRGVRVALWWPSHKTVTTVPLTGVAPSAGVININCDSGHVMLDPAATGGWRSDAAGWATATVGKAVDIAWVSPLCSPSAGAQTIAQIQERLTAVGAPSVSGGGKAAMWTRYLWQTLVNSLAGKEMVGPSSPTSATDSD